jgi:hypothetical protein
MWQRDSVRPILLPGLYCLREGATNAREMICLRVLPNHQRELHVFQVRQQGVSPSRGALRAWWQIAGLTCAGIAKTHGKNGYLLGVVELLPRDAQPEAKPVAAGVVEWHTRFVNLSAWSLASDKDASQRMHLDNGTWAEWQVLGAKYAAADFGEELCKGGHSGSEFDG